MKIIPAPLETEFNNGYTPAPTEENVTVDSSLEREEYVLTVTHDKIIIAGGSNSAVFYARQTLKQLALQGEGLPVCRIRDRPGFPWRGFMIDSARHMQTVDELKKIIDVMSLLKFNIFHWHLTDDQGWRFESAAYPELNTKAAVRPFSDFGDTINNKPYGRVYTKEEMRDIVSYCKERYIDVVPEFDMPGHTSALLSVFPELSCKNDSVEIKTHQGIFGDILCPSKEKTYEVLENIIDEFCDIFPYDIYHIGGDEAPHKQWKNCPVCKAAKDAGGYSGWSEYQNSFMNRMIDYLDKKGKKAIVWNDAVKGKNLDRRAILQYWMEAYRKPSADFANGGGKMILSPFGSYYMDYDYRITPFRKTIAFDPAKLKGLTETGYENVIGVETPIWTEYIRENKKLERFLFPRVIAVAQTAWSEKRFDYDGFIDETEYITKIIKDKGIIFEDEREWGRPKYSTAFGWIRMGKQIFSHKKKEIDY
ncbi:MAG: beta-N-acetylhexosaminidase [Clostridia bacterium]|nr:beta-N-acetylhexosaminidase [Clostridia bacterium]